MNTYEKGLSMQDDLKLLIDDLIQQETTDNSTLSKFEFVEGEQVDIYPKSVNKLNDTYFFIGKNESSKSLYVFTDNENRDYIEKFDGIELSEMSTKGESLVKQCPLNHTNAEVLRELFDFTSAKIIGLENSYGLGDRLGLANPGHIRAIQTTDFKPVLAQQSIRELERTNRTPDEVMDTASWAVFQEGYTDGFGSDADHLKTPEDIDYMIKSGFTMFTIDPSEHVVNEADSLSVNELETKVNNLPWDELESTFENTLKKYTSEPINVSDDFSIEATRDDLLRGLTKYGKVIAHVKRMHTYLKETYPDHPTEIEVSVDETESVTQPFEHFLVANELKRLGIELISLAPRFVGDFEKGIDYKGDIEVFKREYLKHLKIADKLGPYKISIHSGSDKFQVYRAIGSLNRGYVHVKTAGTSYLEALRTIAKVDTELFREILDYSRNLYPTEKRTYHVSADLSKVPESKDLKDNQLTELFRDEKVHTRQVLHVTFGRILTDKNEKGNYIFRERILKNLEEHEETHYAYLYKHFQRHLEPFIS